MRLFIGLFLPTEIANKLEKIQEEIIESRPGLIIKPTNKENFHITLGFIPNLNFSELIPLIQTLKHIIIKEIYVELKNIEIRNKLLLAKLEPTLELVSLAKTIQYHFKNIIKDHQKFFPHITLGRLKQNYTETFLYQNFEVHGWINKFFLVESILKATGAEYKVIEEFNLRKLS